MKYLFQLSKLTLTLKIYEENVFLKNVLKIKVVSLYNIGNI